jgi:hypothetical protein
MSETLQLSYQRLLHGANKILSFPVVHGFITRMQLEREWMAREEHTPSPPTEHGLCGTSRLVSLLDHLAIRIRDYSVSAEVLKQRNLRAALPQVRELCTEVDEDLSRTDDSRAVSHVGEVKAILYGALWHTELSYDAAEAGRLQGEFLDSVRDQQWYRDLLNLLESTFGDTLLAGCSDSRALLPEFARKSTALESESRILAKWFLRISPPLRECESAFLSRLSGVPVTDIEAAHIGWRQLFPVAAFEQKQFPSLGDLFDPIPGPRVYRPVLRLDRTCGATFSHLRIRLTTEVFAQLLRMTTDERRTVESRVEYLIREVGISPYEVSAAIGAREGWQRSLAALEAGIEHIYDGTERRPLTGSLSRVTKASKYWVESERPLFDSTPRGYEIETDIIRHPVEPRLREILGKENELSLRDYVHAALLLELVAAPRTHFFSKNFSSAFSEWRGQLPVDAFVDILTHSDPSMRESALCLFECGQMADLLNWLRGAPPHTITELLWDGMRFATTGPKSGTTDHANPRAFSVLFVGYLLSRFERFPASLQADEYQREIRECMEEAKERVRKLKGSEDPQKIREELWSLGLQQEEFAAHRRGYGLIRNTSASQALSNRERFQYSRLLGQLPKLLSDGEATTTTLEILRSSRIRPETLASSLVLRELTEAHLLVTPEDLKTAMQILDGIAAKGAHFTTLACTRELLRVAVRSDEEGYLGLSRVDLHRRNREERQKVFGAFFRGEIDGSSSSRFKAFLQRSSFGIASLRLAVAEGAAPQWQDAPGPLSAEEITPLIRALREGAGIRQELEIIRSFIDDFRPLQAQYLFSLYRSLKMQHEYCPSDLLITESTFWRSWPDYLFPLELKPGSRLFPDEQSLLEYAWKCSESFIRNPAGFSPKLLLDFELVGLACRLYRTGELSPNDVMTRVYEMLAYGRNFASSHDSQPVSAGQKRSIFDVFERMPEREILIPRARFNLRDLKLSELKGPFESDALTQFEADFATLQSVIETGASSPLEEVSTRLGLELSSEMRQDEEEQQHADPAQSYHNQCLLLVNELAKRHADSISDESLRLIFFAHASRDRRVLGSALRMSSYTDYLERVTSFVEFVGAGGKNPEWCEILEQCPPQLRARFDKVSDVEYLLTPLASLLKTEGLASDGPAEITDNTRGKNRSAKGKSGETSHVAIRLRLHRDAPIFAIGAICDSCLTESLAQHPTKAFVSFAEQGRTVRPVGATFSGGFMLFHTTTDDGNSALIIRGYNPVLTLLSKVVISRLFDEVVQYVAEEIAPALGATEILAPLDTIHGIAFSNRALAHLSFNMRFKDAPRVSVSDEQLVLNRYDIRQRCVRVWPR